MVEKEIALGNNHIWTAFCSLKKHLNKSFNYKSADRDKKNGERNNAAWIIFSSIIPGQIYLVLSAAVYIWT